MSILTSNPSSRMAWALVLGYLRRSVKERQIAPAATAGVLQIPEMCFSCVPEASLRRKSPFFSGLGLKTPLVYRLVERLVEALVYGLVEALTNW